MKCDSCDVEIPPAWSSVIAKNLCPNCEGPIMSDGTIELMVGLKTALEQMPNDPQGIAGWLLSNYQMRKIGDGAPTEFIGVKPKNASAGHIVNADGVKIAGTPLERFQKLAGIKVEAPEKYKALISEINGGILEDDRDEPQRQEREDHLPEADDPEYTKQALKAMQGGNYSKEQLRRPSNEPDENEEIDLSDLHPGLHEDRIKRIKTQRELTFGGGIGNIKRSS
jgi:hypothetical protein